MAFPQYEKGERPCNKCVVGSHSRCKKWKYCSCNCPNKFKKIEHNNQNTKKKYCCRNHLLDVDNVYLGKNGRRICIQCVKIRRMNNIEIIRKRAREHYQAHKNEYRLIRRVMQKSIYERVKTEVLTHYGNGKLECVCCGEDIPQMLTIDHINNDGGIERKKLKRTGHNIYRYLLKEKYPQGYQTLCFNCNSGKHINKGICPHKTINTKYFGWRKNTFALTVLSKIDRIGDQDG